MKCNIRTPYLIVIICFFLCAASTPLQGQDKYDKLKWQKLEKMQQTGDKYFDRRRIIPDWSPFNRFETEIVDDSPYPVHIRIKPKIDLGPAGTYYPKSGEWEPKTFTIFDVEKLWVDNVVTYGDMGKSMGKIFSASASQLQETMKKNRELDYACWEADMAYRAYLRRQQQLHLSGGDLESIANRSQRRTGSKSNVVTSDRSGQTAAGDPLSERWNKLNKAMDDYESEKNAPGDRVENMFKSEHEKMAYDNIIETVNADIERDTQKVVEQQTELSRLQGQIQHLDEQIYQTTSTIEDLQRKKKALQKRLVQIKESGPEMRQEKERLKSDLNRVNENLVAEQARQQSLQAQRSSAGNNISTFMSALSLAGNIASIGDMMSSNSFSGRSKAYSATRSYASTYSKSGTGSGSTNAGKDWSVWSKAHNAKNKAYVQSRLAERNAHWKQSIYRKRTY